MKDNRDSFIFYRSFYEAIKELPPQNKLEMFEAISAFSLDFKEPQLSGISKTIWILIKPQLEANIKKFHNGKKPKKKSKTEASDKQNGSKPEGNVNVNVNENNNVNVNYIYIENEKVFDLSNWFETHRGIWAHDFPTRQKFNLKEKCDLFMLEKSQQTFNDANHIQNSLIRFISQEKKERKGSAQKKDSVNTLNDIANKLISEIDLPENE